MWCPDSHQEEPCGPLKANQPIEPWGFRQDRAHPQTPGKLALGCQPLCLLEAANKETADHQGIIWSRRVFSELAVWGEETDSLQLLWNSCPQQVPPKGSAPTDLRAGRLVGESGLQSCSASCFLRQRETQGRGWVAYQRWSTWASRLPVRTGGAGAGAPSEAGGRGGARAGDEAPPRAAGWQNCTGSPSPAAREGLLLLLLAPQLARRLRSSTRPAAAAPPPSPGGRWWRSPWSANRRRPGPPSAPFRGHRRCWAPARFPWLCPPRTPRGPSCCRRRLGRGKRLWSRSFISRAHRRLDPIRGEMWGATAKGGAGGREGQQLVPNPG